MNSGKEIIMYMNKNARLILASTVLVLAFTPDIASPSAAYSPGNLKLRIWEPCVFELGDAGGDEVVADLTGTSSQGYVPWRWQDTVDDDSVGDCTRARWDAMCDSGITYSWSHAGSNSYRAVQADSNDVLHDWADGDGDGFDDDNVTVSESSPKRASVNHTWFDDNWESTHDGNKSIVILAGCNTDGLAVHVGGRAAFGYTTLVNVLQVASDMEKLFKRMNGTWPTGDPGSMRTVWLAWDVGDGYNNLDLVATGGDTTLCPAVKDYGPKDDTGGSSGTGFVEFDTHCDDSVDPNDILSAAPISGSLNIGHFRWAVENFVTLDYKLKFKYCQGNAYYKYKVTVDAWELVAKGGGELMLDGNQNPSGSDHKAPNGDDFVWIFEK
jgi:hypothetical protein